MATTEHYFACFPFTNVEDATEFLNVQKIKGIFGKVIGPDDELVEEEDEKTYSIVRYKMDEEREVIKTGLTLEEVQEHCSDDSTSGEGWFDGYREE